MLALEVLESVTKYSPSAEIAHDAKLLALLIPSLAVIKVEMVEPVVPGLLL